MARWSRKEGKPLWEMVCDMEPEELVKVRVHFERGAPFCATFRPNVVPFFAHLGQFWGSSWWNPSRKVIDFKHITDVITPEAALELLKAKRPGWETRKALMKTQGYPAYTTSAGWLGYPEEKIRELCKELLADGHKYFKMKVGSPDPQDDVRSQAY